MRVTVLQMSPTHVRDDNIAQLRDLFDTAVASDRPHLVVLPEMWSCLGGTRTQKFEASEVLPDPGASDDADTSLYGTLATLARRAGVVLHGGSIGERVADRLFNTTVVFGPDGRERARYRKIHLFDVVTPSGSGYRESETFAAGQDLATFDAAGLRAGCAICYDLRFPALFAGLRHLGAELIAVPAAFTSETGAAHWSVLLRARAVETQCWIAAAATTGRHIDGTGAHRDTYGHSLICDPWGTVVAEASAGIGWATARVDHALTARIRQAMPVWAHRATVDG